MGFDEDTGSPPFQRKSPVDLNTKIMIAAIISVTTVIFLLTLLHLLSRPDHRRRTAIQRLLLTSAASRPTPKTGLHPSVVAALPASAFTTAEGNETVIECSVCLSVVHEGETVRMLPNCHHTFHAECIDQWFGGQSSCPICRAEAAPRHPMLLTPEPRESAVGAGAEPSHTEGIWTKVSSGSFLSSYPLSSFRKMLGSGERVSCRLVQPCEGEVVPDLEGQ